MQEQNCEGFSFPLNVEESKVWEVRLLTLRLWDILSTSVIVAINKPRVRLSTVNF